MVKLNDVYELRHRAMEEIELGYGTGTEKVKIPRDAIAHILLPLKREWERRRKRLLRGSGFPHRHRTA